MHKKLTKFGKNTTFFSQKKTKNAMMLFKDKCQVRFLKNTLKIYRKSFDRF